jgi:hypothetical protein
MEPGLANQQKILISPQLSRNICQIRHLERDTSSGRPPAACDLQGITVAVQSSFRISSHSDHTFT